MKDIKKLSKMSTFPPATLPFVSEGRVCLGRTRALSPWPYCPRRSLRHQPPPPQDGYWNKQSNNNLGRGGKRVEKEGIMFRSFGSASFWCGSGSADPLRITDPVRIRIRLRIRPIIEQIPIFFFLIFCCKRFETHNDVFVVVILRLLFTYI